MLYICDIENDNISVIDTEDAIVEVASKSNLLIYRKNGVLIAGMTDGSFSVCDGEWLRDEFFQCNVQGVYKKFSKARFKNDNEVFKYLVESLSKCYDNVDKRLITKVCNCTRTCFVVQCICELCRMSKVECLVNEKRHKDSNLVFKSNELSVYAEIINSRKSFKIEWRG